LFTGISVGYNTSLASQHAEATEAAKVVFSLIDRKSTIDPSSDEGHKPVTN